MFSVVLTALSQMIMNGVFRRLQQGVSWSQEPLVEGSWDWWVQNGKSRVDSPVIAWAAKCPGKKSRTRIFLPGATQTKRLFPPSTSHAGD